MEKTLTDLLLEGYRLQGLGYTEESERIYRTILAKDSRNVHALNLLGILCLNSARPEQAIELISRAVKQTPGDAEALANLALAFKDAGKLSDAARTLSESLRHNPRNPVAHNNLGNILAALSRVEEAVTSFRAALQLDPNYVDCLINLADALTYRGQLQGAIAAANRAVQLSPRVSKAHNCLAHVLLKQSRHEDARIHFLQAISLQPGYVDALIGLSSALKETGDHEGANQALLDAIRLNDNSAPAHNSYGVFLEQKGNAKEAAVHFRRAIESEPRFANAYYQLAQLKGASLTENEIAAIYSFFEDPSTTPEQRAPLAFALACIEERMGNYQSSFHFLEIGQAIKAQETPYDDSKVADFYGCMEDVFAKPFNLIGVAASVEQPQPVFVLGMPRSGTSLVEQILASHPDIKGAGELSLMEDTVNQATRLTGKPFPECVHLLSNLQLKQLGDSYLSQLKKRTLPACWIVDKTPMNFQYLGFIATILPSARIIHCRRDPIDNCLSIFKLPFENSHTYAHGLESLGLHYVRYAELMKHWERILTSRMINVDYESLVDDVERQSRKMLGHLELPFDDAVLEYYKTDRLVKTPSASQVRRPIYRDSVAAWKRYESQLQPLINALTANIRSV